MERQVESVGDEQEAEWWFIDDIASYIGVKPKTVTGYRTREQLPEHDKKFGRTPAWRPATIKKWHAERPHPGEPGRPPKS